MFSLTTESVLLFVFGWGILAVALCIFTSKA
jgi:hypothetical protein